MSEFRIEERQLSALRVPSYCRRRHPRSQVDRCVASIEAHGQYQPIIVSGDEILCGVLVFMALRKMGRKTALVHDMGDLPEDRRMEIRYLDNRTFEIGEWNDAGLEELLMGLDKIGVEKVGFTEEEAELFVNRAEPVFAGPSSRRKAVWVCDSCGWRGDAPRGGTPDDSE